jgi:hypothetical protein
LFIYIKHAGYAAPIRKQSLQLLFFMFFFLDEKERKNQENPNVAPRQSLAATRTFIFIRNRDFFIVMILCLGAYWFTSIFGPN